MSKKNLQYVFSVLIFMLAVSSKAYGAAENKDIPGLKFYIGFHDLGEFNDGLAPVKNADGKLGYIDTEGNLVIDYRFDTDRGLIDFRTYGYIFNLTASDEYNSVPAIAVYNKDFYDYEVIPDTAGWDSKHFPSGVCNFKRGYANVYLNGKPICIDTAGNEVVNPFPDRYYRVWPFYQGLAVAQKVENGLFGYIDKNGNEITEFKYLCASHYKDGAAMAVEAVPYKNGVSRYPGTEEFFNRFFPGDPQTTLLIDDADIMYPEGRDIIYTFLDTQGSVLSWGFYEYIEDYSFNAFPTQRGKVFELDIVSEGLILRIKNRYQQDSLTWYEYLDGNVAFTLDKRFGNASPFGPEKIAGVYYSEESFNPGEKRYVDNKGNLLDNAELEVHYPNMFQKIEAVLLGPDYFISQENGSLYLNEIPKISKAAAPWQGNRQDLRVSYFLVGRDNRIIMDCTDVILEAFAKIYGEYWGYDYDFAMSIVSGSDSYNAVSLHKPVQNSNIYYIYINNKTFGMECVGYMTVEG